jgi:hypothetical protein
MTNYISLCCPIYNNFPTVLYWLRVGLYGRQLDSCVTCMKRNFSFRILESPSIEVLISSYEVGFNMPGLNKIFSVQQVPYFLMR